MKAYFWRIGVYLLVGIVGFTFLLPANLFAQQGKQVDYKLLRRDIEVMVGVINTMLKETWLDEEKEHIYIYISMRRVECQGFHLNDYGIVFTLNLPTRYGIGIVEIPEFAVRLEGLEWSRVEREKKAQEEETKKKTAEEILAESLAKLKDQLIDIMGNYGDFIKQVPATGYITIVVFYGDSDSFRGISKRMILTIKRGDISEYRDGKLSMAEFKRRVKSTEY
ncbi:MAG: hypothetical protein OEZ30_10275 [Candidatus Aminicenantes bacterium]|nr:hypothetical protein [Candidatus Aminicenantes bacterium]MDH5715940.1 hypothetical protein [Candidatus Aminicenantes bacterium]